MSTKKTIQCDNCNGRGTVGIGRTCSKCKGDGSIVERIDDSGKVRQTQVLNES